MSLDPAKIPQHIAIIMDGNGRWARERGLPRIEGHRAGADSVRTVVEACAEFGVKYVTLYAFSSENWNRPKHEVDALMMLLERFLEERTLEMQRQNVRLHAIGRIHLLPERCQARLRRSIEETAGNDGIALILALSYGGREEILDGIQAVLRDVKAGKLDPAGLSSEVFDGYLYTRGFPDPDLMIRTSGEMRLSNFLLWQLSYAEIVVTRKYWPEFGKADLQEALEEYATRHRRFGGL